MKKKGHEQLDLGFNPEELMDKARHYRSNWEISELSEKMITEIIHKYLKDSRAKGSSHLGDRMQYVGASDYCERQAYLQRTQPAPFSFQTLMNFRRGKAFESLLAAALENSDIEFERELETVHPEKSWIRAHNDFTMVKVTKDTVVVGIIECKDVNDMPNALYQGWTHQLTMQTGLAVLHFSKEHPNKEVRVKAVLVAKECGSETMKVFKGFKYDENAFQYGVKAADRIMEALKGCRSVDQLYTKHGTLCSFCSYLEDCPAFFKNGNLDLTPIQDVVQVYTMSQQQEKTAEKEKQAASLTIKNVMGREIYGQTDDVAVKMVHVTGSETTDKQALVDFLGEFAPQLLERFKKMRKGYSYPKVTARKDAA